MNEFGRAEPARRFRRMPFSLVPKRLCRSIYALDLDALHARGIRVLFADLDNTLARYSEHTPSEELRAWAQNVEAHGKLHATAHGSGYNKCHTKTHHSASC